MGFHVPNEHRVRTGPLASDDSYGHCGAFIVTLPAGDRLKIIAGDGSGWEHVSVSLMDARRCPSWAQMCAVKALFWDAEDCVMQLHPPESDYVNVHPYVLHLWRPVGQAIPRPPRMMV